MAQRQNDQQLEPFPIWSDVETFDPFPWRGIVDLVSGGFPCQDLSIAGRRKGLQGSKSGLWSHMLRIISAIQPRNVFIENSPNLVVQGLDRIICQLAKLGLDVIWGCFRADALGAPHKRNRVFILGDARISRHRNKARKICAGGFSVKFPGLGQGWETSNSKGRAPEPCMGRIVDGVPFGVDRLRALGNAQVPIVAAYAFQTLKARLEYYRAGGSMND